MICQIGGIHCFKVPNTHAHEVEVIIEVAKGEAKATGRFNAGGKTEPCLVLYLSS